MIKTAWLPNPEIIRPTIDKLLRAFENACPPLGDYSNRVDKGKVEEKIKKLQPQLIPVM
ncbi:MAG: hypothetical protein Q8P80_03780 [Candidatus Levybacteria bacterium]|nr:hypothetical protein [Candidatus Levybacteria bacterium]